MNPLTEVLKRLRARVERSAVATTYVHGDDLRQLLADRDRLFLGLCGVLEVLDHVHADPLMADVLAREAIRQSAPAPMPDCAICDGTGLITSGLAGGSTFEEKCSACRGNGKLA